MSINLSAAIGNSCDSWRKESARTPPSRDYIRFIILMCPSGLTWMSWLKTPLLHGGLQIAFLKSLPAKKGESKTGGTGGRITFALFCPRSEKKWVLQGRGKNSKGPTSARFPAYIKRTIFSLGSVQGRNGGEAVVKKRVVWLALRFRSDHIVQNLSFAPINE